MLLVTFFLIKYPKLDIIFCRKHSSPKPKKKENDLTKLQFRTFFNRALAKQNNCRSPIEKLAPPEVILNPNFPSSLETESFN